MNSFPFMYLSQYYCCLWSTNLQCKWTDLLPNISDNWGKWCTPTDLCANTSGKSYSVWICLLHSSRRGTPLVTSESLWFDPFREVSKTYTELWMNMSHCVWRMTVSLVRNPSPAAVVSENRTGFPLEPFTSDLLLARGITVKDIPLFSLPLYHCLPLPSIQGATVPLAIGPAPKNCLYYSFRDHILMDVDGHWQFLLKWMGVSGIWPPGQICPTTSLLRCSLNM